MEGSTDATKLNLPILKVVSAVIIIGGVIWFASAKSTTIDSHTTALKDLQTEMKSVPTRQEYNNLKGSIDKIETAITEIRNYLIKK